MDSTREEHKIDTLHKVQKCKLIFVNTEEEQPEEKKKLKSTLVLILYIGVI